MGTTSNTKEEIDENKQKTQYNKLIKVSGIGLSSPYNF
jgi:hypothetical protein